MTAGNAAPIRRRIPTGGILMDKGGGKAAGAARPNWLDRSARLEHAKACYRYILGRDPENDAVLERHVAAARTVGALRAAFLRSAEFRRSLPQAVEAGVPDDGGAGPPPDVETTAPPQVLADMIAQQARLWRRVEQEIVPWPGENRQAPAQPALDAPDASGAADAALLLGALRRNRIAPDAVPRLLEHGCGTGRVTPWLAQHFPEITCVDVAGPRLAAARAAARRRGLAHLRWLRAEAADPMPGVGFDLWFSRGVLGWNPPPLACDTLRRAFAALPPGGLAVFSLPTWCPGYRFAVGAWAEGRQPAAPEPHLVPQAAVFGLAAEGGMQVLEAREDDGPLAPPRPWRGHLFVLRKAG
jgi:SAM-dependent methyltransferase